MKPYPITETEADALRQISATVTASTDPIPPEAGNVLLTPADDDGQYDIVDWWPVTGPQLLAFWAMVTVSLLAVVCIAIFAPGYLAGFSTAQIIQTVISWGL